MKKKKKRLPILATITLTVDDKSVHAQVDGMNPLYYLLCIDAMQKKFEKMIVEDPPTPEQAKQLDELVELMFSDHKDGNDDEADA